MIAMPITWLFPLEILRQPQARLLLAPTLAHSKPVLFLAQSFVPGAETEERVRGSNLQRAPALSKVADMET